MAAGISAGMRVDLLARAVSPIDAGQSCHAGKAGDVHAVDIAGAKAIAAVVPISGSETLRLIEAVGRLCASPVVSTLDLPPFDNSAMDGYAVRTSDFSGPGPWRLPVVARIPAGQPAASSYPAGCTVRIFTGAPVPPVASRPGGGA